MSCIKISDFSPITRRIPNVNMNSCVVTDFSKLVITDDLKWLLKGTYSQPISHLAVNNNAA